MTTTRGQHLIGKEIGSCLLEQLLGYGGSSAVFLAHDSSIDQQVAVKVFLPRSTMDAQMQKNFYQRFLREAEAASQLDHPNVLSVYSYGQHQGLPYIVMPYIPGGTLSEYVKKHGPLSLSEANYYLEQIASALDYAHAQGCVHCDVKPANILLDGMGNALLSDFGIVRLMVPDAASDQQVMKSPETLMGTPDYISPEQALGQQLDGRSDVYSLGVTLYFLLTGGPPFKAESSIAMALLHVHETPPALGLLRADVTAQIDGVVARALAKWPGERYQAAGEFSAAFASAVVLAEDADQVAYSLKSADGNGSGARRTLATLQPIVHIKPLWKPRFKLSRLMFAVILLLLLLGSAATVTIVSLLTNGHSHTQLANPKSTVVPSPLDLLADDENDWQQSSTFLFKDGHYHILYTSGQGIAQAFYENHQFTNFRLSVTMAEIQGSQDGGGYYGVILRASIDQSHYYLFDVAAAYGGQYRFLRYDGNDQWKPLAVGLAPSLLPAMGQSNVIAVEARGNTFSFSINGKAVGKPVTDSSKSALSSGAVGLGVEEKGTEVAFSHLSIKQL